MHILNNRPPPHTNNKLLRIHSLPKRTGQRLFHTKSRRSFPRPSSRSHRREETLFPVSVAGYTDEIPAQDHTLPLLTSSSKHNYSSPNQFNPRHSRLLRSCPSADNLLSLQSWLYVPFPCLCCAGVDMVNIGPRHDHQRYPQKD
jgi:hypothetical protein